MKQTKTGFRERFRYAFDNFMSRGGLSIFFTLILLFIGAIVLMAVFRLVANIVAPEEKMANLMDQWWLSFLQIADGGSIAEDTDSNVANRVVGIIGLFVGMVLFSSLVAFITSQFEAALDNMRKGRSRVIETGHTLILGFGDRVLEIVRELLVANQSERHAAIVILSPEEKDVMDEFFRDRLDATGPSHIVTRSGSTSTLAGLRKVGIGQARAVIILNEAADDASPEEKALADARVLKTIMAVVSCTGEAAMPPIVAEIHQASKQKLARNISGRVTVINEDTILAKLMVQTSRISGLAQVYDNLVGFDGNEFYFWGRQQGWQGQSYQELAFRFADSTLLGVRKPDGTLAINPPPTTKPADDDQLLILAEDDSTIKWLDAPKVFTKPAGHPAQAQARQIERQMLVGWSRMAVTIIDEYSNYLIAGSAIDILVPAASPEMRAEITAVAARHPGIKIKLSEVDIDNPDCFQELKPENYDNVILLSADGGEAELRDSETIARLLEFRFHFRSLGRTDIKTQLITEVADSDNTEIIQETGVKDFLISNQFVSKIFAQVSQEPDVLKVYDELFREEGSEAYIKPAALYVTIPGSYRYGELCLAAFARGETAFGVKVLAGESDAGFGISINPAKDQLFDLVAGDCLITLAGDET